MLPKCPNKFYIVEIFLAMRLSPFLLFGIISAGEEPDISEPEINKKYWNTLTDGDIKGQTRGKINFRNGRTAIRYKFLRWPHQPNYVPMPYEMGAEMPIITRGIAQDAARNYGLRTCIHLKPWEGEEQYIKIHQYGYVTDIVFSAPFWF